MVENPLKIAVYFKLKNYRVFRLEDVLKKDINYLIIDNENKKELKKITETLSHQFEFHYKINKLKIIEELKENNNIKEIELPGTVNGKRGWSILSKQTGNKF